MQEFPGKWVRLSDELELHTGYYFKPLNVYHLSVVVGIISFNKILFWAT